MGSMVDGVWLAEDQLPKAKDGAFARPQSIFRHWITPDGAPGPTGEGGFAAQAGRYHLYVSLACPWAHRTLIYRALKGLEEMISVSVTHWLTADSGWTFTQAPGVVPDPVGSAAAMHDIYRRADPHYTGRVTVPVLWDKQTGRMVNNESADIIRMLNSAFDGIGARAVDFYPPHLQAEIDGLNERIYATLNNGVYRSGFAATQSAYEAAVFPLFDTLDWLDQRLAERRFLCGATPTEADWRLFTTLVRFDAVYHGHFKCNLRRLVDYRHLWDYTRDLYQWPGVGRTVDMDHIKRHYYMSHPQLNPYRIVPAGPILDFTAPVRRATTLAAA